MLGETPGLLLREDELAVGEDVVLALLALDDRGVEPILAQVGRETRGPDVVAASGGAVEDLDGHVRSLAVELGPVPLDDRAELEAARERPAPPP